MEFNPCFFCSSSIYPSTPVGVGASSSLNDNAKIRNLKTPLHTFSYFLILGSLWFAEKIDNIGNLHRCEFLAVSALTELLQKLGIATNPTHQMSTCHHGVTNRGNRAEPVPALYSFLYPYSF